MDHPVALMSLDDRVLHLPGDEHGVSVCGEVMRGTWKAGPLHDVALSAEELCEVCFDH